MDYQMDKCAKCGETRKEHSHDGACYGKCGEYVHAEVLTGKTFRMKNSSTGDIYKCVGMSPGGRPIFLDPVNGQEFFPNFPLPGYWEEVREPKIEHMYASISYGQCVHTNIVFWGPKPRFDDNVKFTFTNGKLTDVEIIR